MISRHVILPQRVLAFCLVVLAVTWAGAGWSAQLKDFLGVYSGKAEVDIDGVITPRDMSVEISETRDGFSVKWVSTTYRPDGRTKVAAYEVDFVPTDRDGVFAAAQKRNVFGHGVQLDPMKGEPFVWARLVNDTLTVFSLHVDSEGGYQIQEYHRTITEGGLDLDYQSVRNGEIQRSINAFLTRE